MSRLFELDYGAVRCPIRLPKDATEPLYGEPFRQRRPDSGFGEGWGPRSSSQFLASISEILEERHWSAWCKRKSRMSTGGLKSLSYANQTQKAELENRLKRPRNRDPKRRDRIGHGKCHASLNLITEPLDVRFDFRKMLRNPYTASHFENGGRIPALGRSGPVLNRLPFRSRFEVGARL